jgi:F-type H+-transporting ATPase subunit delta
MQAASREALAALRQNPALAASAAVTTDAALGQLAELYSVAEVLTGEPQLRRAIGDAAASTASRSELVARIFTGKVSAPVLQIVQAAATERWSDPWDLVDSLELLGDEAVFAVAEAQGTIDDVEDELFRFERILESEGRLSTLLDDVNVSPARRASLLDSLVGAKVHPLTRALLMQSAGSPNKRMIAASVRDLLDVAGERRAKSVARVLSAVELTAAQQARLQAVLSDLYGRPITVLTAIDATVRGGLVVRVGDEIIDGSVAARLSSVRSALAS